MSNEQQAPEQGWLLEKMHEGNVHYICADYVLQWTNDPNRALRLARREDAEALTTIVEDCEKIAEHEWPNLTPMSTQSNSPSAEYRLSTARAAIADAAESIANCYCADDDVFEEEKRRLISMLSDVVANDAVRQ